MINAQTTPMTRIRHSFGILTLGAVIFSAGCRDDAQIRVLNDQLRALESAHTQGKEELRRLQTQMRELQEERDKIGEERDKLETRINEATKALEALQKAFDEYKRQYRVSIRKRAPGMELDLVEVEDKRFEKVIIRDLTESSLVFRHQTGTTSVQLSRLKPEMQERLGYQPAAAAPVPASKGAAEKPAIDGNEESRAVERRLHEIQQEFAALQSKWIEQQQAIKAESGTDKGNRALHQQAIASIQAKVRELEAEQQALFRRSQEIANRNRTNQPR